MELQLTEYKLTTVEQVLAEKTPGIEDIDPKLMTLTIKIKGDQFDGTITGEVARAIWGLQENLYRAAAEVLHGEPNIAKLTQEERQSLELTFSVEKGCSAYRADGRRLISRVLDKVVDKMPPEDTKYVFVAGMMAFVGSTLGTAYLAKNAMVEQAKALIEPIERAITLSGDLVAKAARNAESVDYRDRAYPKDEIKKLNSRSLAQKAVSDNFESVCVVTGYQIQKGIGVVSLVDETGMVFQASIPPKGLFEDTPPDTAKDIAHFIDSKQKVRVLIYVKESKAKTERVVTSWDPVLPDIESK